MLPTTSSPVRILGAFADTLVLNVYPTNGNFQVERHDLPTALKAELEQLKALAQDREEDIPSRFVFNGANLLMRTKGSEGFNWILRNDALTLAVNRSSKMQLWAQVRCSSQYLWSVRDLGKIISDVHLFLIVIFGQLITLQPSALDLACDVLFFDIGTIDNIKQHFITRAQLTELIPASPDTVMIDGPNAIKERWGRITGLPFGARTGALSALIYDKTHEIKYHSPEKAWFIDSWQHQANLQGFSILSNALVYRVEIRFKRPALNEMMQLEVFHGVDDAFELEKHLPGLWAYAVGHVGGFLKEVVRPARKQKRGRAQSVEEIVVQQRVPDGWLRYVVPPSDGDTNRSRWPVHPDWRVIQSAFTPAPLEESDYEREQREREELLTELDEYLSTHPFTEPSTPGRAVSSRRGGRRPAPALTPLGDEAPGTSPAADPLAFDLAPYVRKRKHTVNTGRMVAQIAGCLITAEAWRRHPDTEGVDPDISDTIHYIYQAVQSYLQENQRDFAASVHKKRVLYSLEQALADLDDTITSSSQDDDNEATA